MQTGRFITLEGGEGSGKTTQIALLLKAFEVAGISAVSTREPGGTPSAEDIRRLLVCGDAKKWDDVAELLLFYAARREHLVKKVWPTLALGQYVISDRFVDSTRVYQGFAKGLNDDYVLSLHRLAVGAFMPDVTFWLEINVNTGLKRAKNRATEKEENRFESLQDDFHKQVQQGFAELAAADPLRIERIDASQSIAAVHCDMIAALNWRLGLTLKPQA